MSVELDSDSWRDLSSLFDEALRLPEDERLRWLYALKAARPERHAQLLRMLEADANAESEGFLRVPPRLDGAADDTEPGTFRSHILPGDGVGPYTLVRELGRGGMGTVWLAERTDGALKRPVALKLPHAGLTDRAAHERFDRERDILAALAHPHIARLYDAGVTAEGQPFLALEFVDGIPITDDAGRRSLDVRSRIALFLHVLDAVQFAHRNLVVHRDLKPSNVLVRPDGVAMLLDFGIAKLLEAGGGPSGTTDATELGGSPMTPRYASPEQIEGGKVTTGSDVYSLGVMLFELLTGALPYRVKQGTRSEIQAAIAAGDTIPPSRAAARGGKRLAREVAGDLDGIILKAIEKDPGRRYPSAEAFARDLTRFLDGEAVEARPNTRIYRLRKFAKRHRIGVGVAAAVTAAILGLSGFAIVQMRAAERERDRAGYVSKFLVSLFNVSDPNEAKGKTVTAREILDRGVAKIDDLATEPLVQADLLITMGTVYQNLGLYESALPLLEKSLALRRRYAGSDDYETMESINNLATLFQDQGQLDRAETLFREALERRRRVLGPDHADTLNAENNLALVLQMRGKLDEAEPLFRTSLEGKRRTLKGDDADLLPPINNLAMLLKQEGKIAEAKPYLAELVDKARRLLGDDDPHTLTAVSNLGLLLLAEGRPTEAEPYLRDALERRRRVLGPDHPQTLMSMTFVGDCLRQSGRLVDARPYLSDALAGLLRVLTPDHPRTLAAKNFMGLLLQDEDRLPEAERSFREALDGRRAKLGADHGDTIQTMANVASILDEEGQPAAAEPLAREAVERSGRSLSDGSPVRLISVAVLGSTLTRAGRAAEAEPLLAAALDSARRNLLPTQPELGSILLRHGECLTALGRYPEAEAELLEARSIMATAAPERDRLVAASLANLHARWRQ
jgi:serine/threonine protein kinase/Tfp pilus assembly protein PilF